MNGKYRNLQVVTTVVALVAIAGCAPLVEVVKRNADAAQEIDKRCTIVGDAMVLPQNAGVEQIRDEVAARLRLRLTGTTYKLCKSANGSLYTCKPENLTEEIPGSHLSIFPVRPISARLEELRKKLPTRTDFKPELDDADKNIEKIRQNMANIHAAIDALRSKLGGVDECENKRKCATKVLTNATELVVVLTGEKGKAGAMQAVTEALAALEVNIRLLEQKARDLNEPIAQKVLEELLRLVDEGRHIFAVAQQAVAALRQQDVLAIAEALFGDVVRYRAADASLRYLEGALAPVDRFVDKLDDKWYLAGSIGVMAFETDVQRQFDQLYEYIWANKLRYWDLQLAFARASCARLSASPPPNSTVMPFIYRMFVNGLPRMACGARPDAKLGGEPQAECVREGKEPINASTEMVSQEDFKALTIANKLKLGDDSVSTKAINSSDPASPSQNTVTPSNAESGYSRFNSFEICYQAELIARAKGVHAAGGEMGNVVGYSCGDYIYRQLEKPEAIKEQKSALQPAGVSGEKSSGDKARKNLDEMRAALEVSTQRVIVELRGGEAGRSATIPPVQPSASPARNFCGRLEARAAGVRCYPDSVGGYALKFDDAFPRGDWKSVVLEAKLERVGEFLHHQGHRFDAVVQAAASQAPVNCAAVIRSVAPIADRMIWHPVTPKSDATGSPATWVSGASVTVRTAAGQTCSGPNDDGNRLLALARANWAGDVVRRSAGVALKVTGVTGEKAGYPYDTPSDRKLTLRLMPVSR